MIVLGYPCIGKSTIASKNDGIIDLESSNFKVTGRDNTDWHVGYCKLAKELSDKGLIVLVSTHSDVQRTMKELDSENSFLCFPDIDLKEFWIGRLYSRYRDTRLEKDLNAMKWVSDHYEDDIRSMKESSLEKIIITKNKYNLEELLRRAIY